VQAALPVIGFLSKKFARTTAQLGRRVLRGARHALQLTCFVERLLRRRSTGWFGSVATSLTESEEAAALEGAIALRDTAPNDRIPRPASAAPDPGI